MRARSMGRWAVASLVVVLVAAVAFWAGRVTLVAKPLTSEVAASSVTAQVTEQTVGRQISLNVTVEQKERPLAANSLTGMVTEVRDNGDDVRAGDVLYRVANVPVRAVAGRMPFYRPLTAGERGPDVHQLQSALVQLGYLGKVNGTFGASTTSAVKRWQKKLGQPETGSLGLGELVAVPKLPTRLWLDTEVIAPGLVLAGGEKAVLGAVGEPTFSLPLSEAQTRVIPESATVTVPFQGREWTAIVAASETKANGEVRYRLSAPGGGPVCGGDCAVVLTGEKLSILSKVAVVPPVSGPAVPVAAVTTRADGSAFVTVIDTAGVAVERDVKVRGSQDGVAVVDGVTAGETVKVLSGPR